MKSKNEQKQKVLTRFAAIVSGIEGAEDETRATALSDAILHGVTNTEYMRESLRLRVLGFRVPAGPVPKSLPSRIIS